MAVPPDGLREEAVREMWFIPLAGIKPIGWLCSSHWSYALRKVSFSNGWSTCTSISLPPVYR